MTGHCGCYGFHDYCTNDIKGHKQDDTAHLSNPPREVCSACGHVAQYRDDVRHDASGVWHGPTCGGYYVEEDETP